MTTTDQFKILEELDADATLQSILDYAVESTAPATGKARSEEIQKAISALDGKKLMEIQDRLSTIVGQILENHIDTDNLQPCTDEQLHHLMVELLDQKDLKRLIDVRYSMIRLQIFHHITEMHRAKGVPDPEWAPGEVFVPEVGKKFTREGGRIKGQLDQEALAEALGPERWKQVTTDRHIPAVPAHTVTELDEQKFLALVKSDPSVMELFGGCVRPGGRTTQSFHTR